jgi:hypothetical protein
MRGLKQELSTSIVIAGHAFVQNLRRGHYELAVDEPVTQRVAVAFSELALAIRALEGGAASACHPSTRCNRASFAMWRSPSVEQLGGCPTPTTRQASGGDRHLKFYEVRDNLRPSGHPLSGGSCRPG